MTSSEKKMILERVLAVKVRPAPDASRAYIKSPWTVYSFSSLINPHRCVSAVAVVIIVLVAGNSAVLASYEALPGDTLYPIKVGVVEPIRVALASTPVAKAEVHAELVQTRLQEAETLAARGRLTPAREQEIQERIEIQKTALAMNVTEVQKIAPDKAQDIDTTVEARLNTHERVLSVLALNRGQVRTTRLSEQPKALAVSGESDKHAKTATKQSSTVHEDVVIARTSSTESVPLVATFAVPSAPAAPSATGVSAVSAPAVAPVGAVATPAEVRNVSPIDVRVETTPRALPVVQVPRTRTAVKNITYEKKKARVQSLIQQVNTQLEQATSTATSTNIRQPFTAEAKSVLLKAQEALREADAHDQNGETDQSYSALLDSERSSKEATFLLEANTRIGNDAETREIRSSAPSVDGVKKSSKKGK